MTVTNNPNTGIKSGETTFQQDNSWLDINNYHMKIHMKVYNKMLSVNSKIDEILRRSSQKSKMITNLIQDLLDLAKYENTVFKINEDYFNLIEVITEAFNIVAYAAEEKNCNLFLEFD